MHIYLLDVLNLILWGTIPSTHNIKFSHIWFFHIHLLLFGKVYECNQPFKLKYSDAHEYCTIYVFTQTDLTFLTRQD